MAQTGQGFVSGRGLLLSEVEELPDDYAQIPQDGGSPHTVLWYRTIRVDSSRPGPLRSGDGEGAGS